MMEVELEMTCSEGGRRALKSSSRRRQGNKFLLQSLQRRAVSPTLLFQLTEADFRFLPSGTVREKICIVPTAMFVVICYSSHRALILAPVPSGLLHVVNFALIRLLRELGFF